MRRVESRFRPAAAAGDLLIAAASLYLAFLLRTHVAIPGTEGLLPVERVRFTFANVVLVAAGQVIFLSLFGLYDPRQRFRDPLARRILPALFFEFVALSSVYFLAFAQAYAFPRSVLVLYIAIDALLLSVWRALLDRLFPQRRRRAVIVGTGRSAALVASAIRRHPWTGVELLGFLGDGLGADGLALLGPIDRLSEIARDHSVDEIILTPEESGWRDRISERIPAGGGGPDLLVWPSPFETMIGRLRFRIVGDLPLLEARIRPVEGIGAACKRAFDGIVSAFLLLVSVPLVVIAAAAIAATSKGGVLYRQTRIGKDGETFDLWKLRTMRVGAEEETGAVLASPGDPRITAIGRALRSARIDEIPQLWNVLVGDMSLVGPRPERPEFTRRFVETVPGYSLRHAVRPGLTGLAQVSGDYSSEPDIKLRYDLAYLNNWSFGLDLSILMRTLPVIFTRRGL